MTKKILVVIALITSGQIGCATAFYKSASAGQIGCMEKDVEIGEVNSGLRTQTWTATCKGEKFICTSISSEGLGSNQISCKKAR